MIRLVTQFDSVETHPSLATPTCCGGCCCSCCSCLASAIGASSLSALHVRALQRDQKPWEKRAGASALAFFSLPIAVALAVVAGGTAFVIAPLVWGLLLWIAYRRAGSEHAVAWSAAVALLGSLAIVGEFVVAVATLDAFGAYFTLSIVVGVLVAVAGIVAFR